MDIKALSDFFLFSSLVNYGLLIVWILMFVTAKDFVKRVHGRWFQLSPENFDRIHYTLMGQYKLLVFIFNLSPYLILKFFL